jgi:hypothetical protein
MTTTLDADLTVETFANAVRGELFDLDAESIDDLTDGLEADLADKLADGEALGDPAAYAAELRAAAGVAPVARRRVVHNARANLAGLHSRIAPFMSNPVVAYFASLRPVWWLARGVLLSALLNTHRQWSAVPNDPVQLLLLVVLMVASVQWGRGRWLPWKWSRPTLIVASVIALLMAPVVAGITQSQLREWWTPDEAYIVTDGLVLNGSPVTNVFAYGPDGELLVDVRLYDQSGNPLSIVPDGYESPVYWDNDGDGKVQVPSESVAGSSGWNVYPLNTVPYGLIDPDTGAVPSTTPRTPPPPFASLQRLLDYEPESRP